MKWAFELEELEVIYKLRTAIKGQELANFLAEFTYWKIILRSILNLTYHLSCKHQSRLGSYTWIGPPITTRVEQE